MIKQLSHSLLNPFYQNRFGYIGTCTCCDEIQFSIGNVVSFMPVQAFLKLHISFQKLTQKADHSLLKMPCGRNKLMLQTPVDNFLLSLSLNEFRQVMALFDRMADNLKLSKSLRQVESLN